MTRTIAFLLLAATAATPLAAQDWQHRGDQHGDRGDHRGDQQRGDGGQRGPAAQPGPAVQPAQRPHMGNPAGAGGARAEMHTNPAEAQRGGPDVRRGDRQGWQNGPGQRPGGNGVVEQRGDHGRPGGNWHDGRGDNRPGAIVRGDQGRPDGNWRDGRGDNRPGAIVRGDDRRFDGNRHDDRGGRWNNGWRNDRRYDWKSYRYANRDRFRLPRYYAPRGYSYRRWSPGYRIEPYFYGSSYWISDPWEYRLPPAYGPYRWVRYYDDVLLIDVTNGLVVDAIYGFFWR